MTLTETVNAKKTAWKAKDALRLLADAEHLYAAKGRKVVHVDLRTDAPSRKDLLALVLGPTGNLRAPTIRRGTTIIVGFDEATYERFFG